MVNFEFINYDIVSKKKPVMMDHIYCINTLQEAQLGYTSILVSLRRTLRINFFICEAPALTRYE